MGELTAIARNSRRGAMYGASASAQIYEAIGEAITHLIDFADIVDVSLTNAIGNLIHGHIQRFEFTSEFPEMEIARVFYGV